MVSPRVSIKLIHFRLPVREIIHVQRVIRLAKVYLLIFFLKPKVSEHMRIWKKLAEIKTSWLNFPYFIMITNWVVIADHAEIEQHTKSKFCQHTECKQYVYLRKLRIFQVEKDFKLSYRMSSESSMACWTLMMEKILTIRFLQRLLIIYWFLSDFCGKILVQIYIEWL